MSKIVDTHITHVEMTGLAHEIVAVVDELRLTAVEFDDHEEHPDDFVRRLAAERSNEEVAYVGYCDGDQQARAKKACERSGANLRSCWLQKNGWRREP